MIFGFNLRHVFPELSAFAWGIPALTLTTTLIQMTFLRMLLASKIWDLEKAIGVTISTDDDFVQARSRKRK
jgi:hypothetical protein